METPSQGPDYQWMTRDLREQLGSAMDTVTRLRAQVELVRNKLLFYADQGDGLTQEQLLGVYDEIAKLFPRRVRKTSDGVDVPL